MIEFTGGFIHTPKDPPAYPQCEGSLLPVRIEPINKQKKRVHLDDGTVLHLYNSEIREFGLQEECALEGQAYTELMQKLCKRARARALHLLKNADRPGTELAQKLRAGGYPETAIADAMAYLDYYRYIDDDAYIQRYIAAHAGSKSRQQILYALRRKGLDGALIEQYLEQDECSEADAALRLLVKYCRSKDATDSGVRQKAYGYLMRRGFSMSDIEHAYSRYLEGLETIGEDEQTVQ